MVWLWELEDYNSGCIKAKRTTMQRILLSHETKKASYEKYGGEGKFAYGTEITVCSCAIPLISTIQL